MVFREIGRRRLYRVVVVYLLVGLAALEGMSNLESALNFPMWTDTLVAVLLLAGFPVVLLIGWFYDFTGVGFVKTEPAATFETPTQVLKGQAPVRNEL